MSAGWAMSLRLAWRDARRRPGRTALVVLVIGLPVAALATGLIVMRTAYQSPEESRAVTVGQADQAFSAVVEVPQAADPDAAVEALAEAVPAGSRIATVTQASDAVVGEDGRLERIDVSDQPLDDPLFAGRLTLGDGRAPEGSHEVAAGEPLLRRLDLGVGDEIDLLALGRVTITGTVRETSANDFRVGVVTGHPLTPTRTQLAAGFASATLFVDLPDGEPPVAAPAGFREIGGGTGEGHLRRHVADAHAVGAVGFVVMGTIAAAAFAVSARRHLRVLGILAANGVAPGGLRRIMVLQGVMTGALASTAGIGLALVAGQLVEPHLDRLVSRAVTPLDVPVAYLAGPWVMGVVAAAVAAWLPARTAARVPVLSALAGRRPQPPSRALGPVAGLATGGVGVFALTVYAGSSQPPWGLGLAGGVLVLAGATACVPWLVARTEPVAARLPGSLRLAARGLGRNRLRVAAVVTAVTAPALAATFAATLVASHHEPWRDEQLRDDQLVLHSVSDGQEAEEGSSAPPEQVLDEVRDVVPGADEAPLRLVAPPALPSPAASDDGWGPMTVEVGSGRSGSGPPATGDTSTIGVASPDLLAALAAPDGTADLLDRHTVVALGAVPDDLVVRRMTLEGQNMVPSDPVLFDRDDVVVADPTASHRAGLPRFLVSPDWVASRGLGTFDAGVLMRSPSPLTGSQRDALRDLFRADNDDAWIRHQVLGTPPPTGEVWSVSFASPDEDRSGLSAAIVGGALVFTLLVVAATLALNGAESRDERSLLLAVGVPPRAERALRAWQASLIPLMAMVVAVPLGLATALAVAAAWPTDLALPSPGMGSGVSPMDPTVPWAVVAGLLAGVPLVSGLLARLLGAVVARVSGPLDLLSALAGD